MEGISTIDESRESNLNNFKVTGEQPINSSLSFKDFAVEFANKHLSIGNIGEDVKSGEIGEILKKLEGNQDLIALMQKVKQMVSEKQHQPGRGELVGRLDNHHDVDIVDAIIKDLNAANITPLQRIQILYLTVFCNFNGTMFWKPSQDGYIMSHCLYLEHLPKINGYVEFIWEALDMLGKQWIDKYELDKIIIGMDDFLETVLKNPELGCHVVNKFKKFATFDQIKNCWRNKELFSFVMELVGALECIHGLGKNRLYVVDDLDCNFENLLNRIASCYDFNNEETKNKILALWKDKGKGEFLQCYRSLPSSSKPSPSFIAKCKYTWFNIKLFFKWIVYRIRLLIGIEKAGTESIFNYVHSPMGDTKSDLITKTNIEKKTYDNVLGEAIGTMMGNLFFKVYEEIKKSREKKVIQLKRIDDGAVKTNEEKSNQLSNDKIMNENIENKIDDVEIKRQSQEYINNQNDKQNLDNFPSVNVEDKNDDIFLDKNEIIYFSLIDILRNIKIDDNEFRKNNNLNLYFFVKSENSGDNYEFNDKAHLPFNFLQAVTMSYNSDYQGRGITTKDVKMFINYGVDPNCDLDIEDTKNENMDLLKKAGYIQLDFSKDLTQNSGAYCQIKHNGTVVGHAWKEKEKVISDIDKNMQFINKLFGKPKRSQAENQTDIIKSAIIGYLMQHRDNPVVAQIFDNSRVPRQEDNNSNRNLE